MSGDEVAWCVVGIAVVVLLMMWTIIGWERYLAWRDRRGDE